MYVCLPFLSFYFSAACHLHTNCWWSKSVQIHSRSMDGLTRKVLTLFLELQTDLKQTMWSFTPNFPSIFYLNKSWLILKLFLFKISFGMILSPGNNFLESFQPVYNLFEFFKSAEYNLSSERNITNWFENSKA
jgi:hypothetical protein